MKNAAISIRARLLNHSRLSGLPFNDVLEQYALGRFFWRLSQSRDRSRFILKGAQLFRLWSSDLHRPTRDIDLLGYGDSDEASIVHRFTELLEAGGHVEDGLVWGPVKTQLIRNEMDYGGVRVLLLARLDGARIPLQVDVGFGDAVTPNPRESVWEGLLGFPSAELLVYPPETVVAEKLEAAVLLGLRNSRMKDFFDLHWLSCSMEFQLATLCTAVRATFEKRGTALPEVIPVALTETFSSEPSKVTQWEAFLRKSKLPAGGLKEVAVRLQTFLTPVLFSPLNSELMVWRPGSGWKPVD